MKYRKLGKNGPIVSAMGLGCMGMSAFYGPADEHVALKVIHQAFDKGITFFDTADMYGNGSNEVLLGKAIKNYRDKVVLASKCGIEFKNMELRIHNSREYIRKSCHESLKRLGIEAIDVYYLHRYNPEVPIEHSMHTMLELIEEGKIHYVGLSEVDAKIVERAYAILGDKLVALQSEYSIINSIDAEAILPTCRKLNISFIAFSPLGRGLLGGKLHNPDVFKNSKAFDVRSIAPQFQSDIFENNLLFVQCLAAIGQRKNCTTAQLSIAWLLAQGSDIIPIPGTKRMEYLKENLGALDVDLSVSDLKAIAQVVKANPIKGARLL